MAITADFHLHSSFSGDSDASMESMIERAIQKGLTHMCFTEHMDFKYPISESCPEGTFEINTDSYLYDLLKYREKYASQIQILFGIELGLQTSMAKEIAIYSKSYDFDFIIGSSHIANGKDPYFPEFYALRSEEEAYREYFSCVIDNIKRISNYDVYGHLDYVVRYGPMKDKNYSYDKYKDLFDTMLELLLEKEKGIEINTAGLRKGLREAHPCMDVLKRYKELGGEIVTVGSDAHSPVDIASYFDVVADMLTECGFKYYSVFQNRVAEFKKI